MSRLVTGTERDFNSDVEASLVISLSAVYEFRTAVRRSAKNPTRVIIRRVTLTPYVAR